MSSDTKRTPDGDVIDPLFDLTGKVILVTGGSRGLGHEMAMAFAKRGADIIIASRKLENCEKAADEVRALGRRALAIGAHCGKWDEVDRIIEESYAAFGRVDVLVNNAGMSIWSPSAEVTEKLFDSVVSLNFKGPFRLASQIAHRMNQGDGGAIINISSTAALMPMPNGVPYSGAKAALNAMTLSFAHEFPKVRVNAISCGPFLSDISRNWSDLAKEKARNVVGRPGRMEEIVTTALYLASPASSYTTGTVIRVDGGLPRLTPLTEMASGEAKS